VAQVVVEIPDQVAVETPDQMMVEIPDSDRSLKVPPKNEGRGDSSVRTRKDLANIRSAAELCFILRPSHMNPELSTDYADYTEILLESCAVITPWQLPLS
jgi:hypothetical protein